MVHRPHLTAARKHEPVAPPLLTRREFNEQHVKDVGSCLLRRGSNALVAKRRVSGETPQLDDWREHGRLGHCGTTGTCRRAHMKSAVLHEAAKMGSMNTSTGGLRGTSSATV